MTEKVEELIQDSDTDQSQNLIEYHYPHKNFMNIHQQRFE